MLNKAEAQVNSGHCRQDSFRRLQIPGMAGIPGLPGFPGIPGIGGDSTDAGSGGIGGLFSGRCSWFVFCQFQKGDGFFSQETQKMRKAHSFMLPCRDLKQTSRVCTVRFFCVKVLHRNNKAKVSSDCERTRRGCCSCCGCKHIHPLSFV